MKRITSNNLIAELNNYKLTDEYLSKTEIKKLEAVLDYELMIKFEKNREIFEEEFGYYPEGDLITDEDLDEMRATEKQIEEEVAESFKNAGIYLLNKPKTYNSKKNMTFLFR